MPIRPALILILFLFSYALSRAETTVGKFRTQITQSKNIVSPSRLQLLVYPFNYGRYVEKAQDQELTLRQPENFAIGLRFGRISSFVESSQFEEQTGQGNYSIERRRKSHLLWANYDVFQVSKYLTFPLGFGLGVYNESIITKLASQEDKSAGDYQWNSGFSLGAELRYELVTLKTEGQLLFANNQNPNPSWAAFIRLGFLLF